jgi:hypothetical protein
MWNAGFRAFKLHLSQVCKSLPSDPKVRKLGGLSFYRICPSFWNEILICILIFHCWYITALHQNPHMFKCACFSAF